MACEPLPCLERFLRPLAIEKIDATRLVAMPNVGLVDGTLMVVVTILDVAGSLRGL